MRSLRRLFRIYFRLQFPALLALMFSLYGFVNAGLLPRPELRPLTTVIFLFYWACYWPRLMHPSMLFIIGFLEDVLYGSVLGLHPFLYLLIYLLVLSQRRLILKEPFPVIWAIFAFSTFVYTILSLLAFRLFEGHVYFGIQPFSQWLITVVVYPFFHQLCIELQTYLVRVRPVSGRTL